MMRKFLITILIILFLTGCSDKSGFLIQPELEDLDFPVIVPSIPRRISVIENEPIGESIPEREGIVHVKFMSIMGYAVGTGFFIKHRESKYLVTAGHNVGKAHNVSVFRGDGSIKIEIIEQHIDIKSDIALFKITTEEKCFELGDPTIFSGILDHNQAYRSTEYKPVEVEMYGYPTEWHFRKVDGSVYQTIFDGAMFVCTGNCDSGMSGGPWINKKTGKIVAITSLKLFDKTATGGVPVGAIIQAIHDLETK